MAARLVGELPDRGGRLRFAHMLIRDAVYEELPATRRLRLHREIGEALEALYAGNLEPHLAELAHHYLLAGAAGAERAIRYAAAAGRPRGVPARLRGGGTALPGRARRARVEPVGRPSADAATCCSRSATSCTVGPGTRGEGGPAPSRGRSPIERLGRAARTGGARLRRQVRVGARAAPTRARPAARARPRRGRRARTARREPGCWPGSRPRHGTTSTASAGSARQGGRRDRRAERRPGDARQRARGLLARGRGTRRLRTSSRHRRPADPAGRAARRQELEYAARDHRLNVALVARDARCARRGARRARRASRTSCASPPSTGARRPAARSWRSWRAASTRRSG